MVWFKLLLDQTRGLMEHLPRVLFAEMLDADCALFGIKVDIWHTSLETSELMLQEAVCQLSTQWPPACKNWGSAWWSWEVHGCTRKSDLTIQRCALEMRCWYCWCSWPYGKNKNPWGTIMTWSALELPCMHACVECICTCGQVYMYILDRSAAVVK